MLSIPKPSEDSSLGSLLSRFAGRRVLVVGDLVADHYIYGETDRVSREAPVLVVRYESAEVKLGGAANAAANLRALGAKVTTVGVIGRDAMGAQMRALLRAQGIRLLAPRAPGIPTETKTRILAGGVNTRRQQMLRLDRGAHGSLPDAVSAELAALVQEAASDAEAVLVSDYGAGVLGAEVIEASLAAARRGIPLSVDSRYNLEAFAGATLIKPNEPELAAFTGVSTDTEAGFAKAIRTAQKRLRPEALVVTRGRSGMVVAERGAGLAVVPAHGTQPAVDVTGAGDTVAATLTLALASGGSFLQAARLANIAGALKVQKPGTATVSGLELARELGGQE